MISPLFPSELSRIFATGRDPDSVFVALLPTLGEILQCDRCFLYLRNPETQMGRVPYCWRRNDDYPNIYDPDWKPEPPTLVRDDPMFAAAVRAEPSILVDDVETADPAVVNRDFESQEFGHRALIHAHLCADRKLWGILQPCVFNQPRIWSDSDSQLIDYVVSQLTPLAIAYVQDRTASNPQQETTHS